MALKIFFCNRRGNIFLLLLFLILAIAGAAHQVSSNPQLKKKLYRQFGKTMPRGKALLSDTKNLIQNWRKKQGEKKSALVITELEPYILRQQLPFEMMRHQPGDITVCSFDANFLLNGSLNDGEFNHLANILRFCDLTAFQNLKDQKFPSRMADALKQLRYNARVELSPASTWRQKGFFTFLYRDDRVASSQKMGFLKTSARLWDNDPFYAGFKSGNFDFTVVGFASATNLTLPQDSSIVSVLLSLTESLRQKNPNDKDTVILGDFPFTPSGMTWSNSALLPGMARMLRSTPDTETAGLFGNFWFQRKNLREFTGESGVINLSEEFFPALAPGKQPSSAAQPIWAQFKVTDDDDD